MSRTAGHSLPAKGDFSIFDCEPNYTSLVGLKFVIHYSFSDYHRHGESLCSGKAWDWPLHSFGQHKAKLFLSKSWVYRSMAFPM